ncbi:MAG: hypothetical protein JW814_01005 [Candidatus Krumholzibacteriota bacterium]|nr:hypothetical protein [Candidatus Krumholzibacteriota bacterium]
MNEEGTVSFTLLAGAIIKKRYFAVLTAVIGSILSLAVAFLLPRTYTSESVILPSGQTGPLGALGSTLNMIDIGMNIELPANSSYLFPTILESTEIRKRILRSNITRSGTTAPVFRFIGSGRAGGGEKSLARITSIIHDKKTGILRVRVTTKDPELSFLIASQYPRVLEEFNDEKRKAKASFDCDFIDNELERAGRDLFLSEEVLSRFEKNNRHCFTTTNPEIRLEHDRLLRDLHVREDFLIDLVKKRELADIDRLRETAIVRILDRPNLPRIKSGPPRKMIAMAGGCISLLIGLIGPVLVEVSPASIIREYLRD